MLRVSLAGALFAASLALSASPAAADEGMWTFENFPAARVKATYGVTIDDAWLQRLRAAAVRIPGCSASVVSSAGLVLTNNHCVTSCLVQLSSADKDHLKDGVLTASRAEERQCAGMWAEVLMETTDITDQVRAAVAGKSGAAFTAARDAVTSAAEGAACKGVASSRCQTTSLYRGGQYVVYRYHRYSDVRMVFAPEFATAFFGGDPDNFNFPRYDMDSAFLRVYEGGKPAKTPNFLKWSAAAPKAGEATFVPGNPGSTERLLTVSQLESYRDLSIPVGQLQRSELRGRLIEYGRRGEAEKRLVADPIFNLENGFKVYFGRQFALNDKAFMDAKRAQETELRAKVAADPALAAEIGDPWSEIARAQEAYAVNYLSYRQLEAEAGRGSVLFSWARGLVRAAAEREKPAADRLPEFADARLGMEERRLTAPRAIEAPLEQLYLEHWLLKSREYLAASPADQAAVLGRESPEGLSRRLVADTKLADPAVRKALWDGGMAAIKASDDPLIRYVLQMDPAARAARAAWETEVAAPTDRAAERIARARFAVYGDSTYPDATFTLRLSYGKVDGWTHRGTEVTPFTTIGGTFERATGEAPYALAPSWIAAEGKLNKDIVYNYTTTNDIIGGNSGSPVVNAKGEVIGAAFDGNIHSLGGAYGYDPVLNRMVVVSSAAITEALKVVYGREALVKELMTGK
jgi:hypothetical protein